MIASIDELKHLLPQCLLPDQVRIGQRLAQALQRARPVDLDRPPVDRWLSEARASIQTRQARGKVLEHLRYPDELPITARKDEIVAALRVHPVVVVAGETGSGKTTQLPKMLLEAGLGLRARIGCTQPRRVAALSISQRLAEELQVGWGHEVGCKIRFSDRSRPETSVKVMTDGILLAEVQGDPLLTEYEAILLDEAHERSLNIDFLLGYLRTLLQKRTDLRLVITSATIDTARFAQAFGGAPVIEVSGRMYPVEVRYSPLDEHAEEEGEVTYVDATANVVGDLLAESSAGDILVFMPGERDIRETADLLRSRHGPGLDVVPLFGRLTASEQHRVFAPGPARRVVVATNIAETSLTVPRIRYVVDTGLARINRYHPGTRSNRLPVEPISQSSANQRQGRCGRVAEGTCVRLYAETDFLARPLYTEPEIQRCDLADVILRMKAFGLGEIETFPFLDPPGPQAIRGAYQLLQELGALDEQRELTPLGRRLARLPVDPAIGRMILEARRGEWLADVLVIAAGLSIQDPRERPMDKRDQAEAAHRRFQHPLSDFLTLLNIWDAFHETWESLKTQSQLRKFCKAHFLSFMRMREWIDVHAQLEEAVGDIRGDPAEDHAQAAVPGAVPVVRAARHPARPAWAEPRYAAVHRAILTGLFGHVARREERNLYRLGGNKQAMVFPGSGLFDKAEPASGRRSPVAARAPAGEPRPTKQPEWLVAGELLETSRLFVRLVAAIDPEWVIELAPHLVKVSHENAGWDREAGRVLCTERVSLRGLLLRERRVGYLQVNPAEATSIFIQSALVEGDLDATPYPFLERNRQVREKVEMWQTRLPHRVVTDLDRALHEFYTRHLSDVGSVHDLNRLIKSRQDPDFLCATEADLLGEHAAQFDRQSFPDTVSLAAGTADVTYAYAPGEERDGVTLRLTVPIAEAVDVEALNWVVPALREERVLQLLQRLPKELRRRLMPLKHTAAEILRTVEPAAGPFLEGMSRFLQESRGVEVPVTAWPLDALPEHLRPRFEVVGQGSQPLAAGRDLKQLCRQVREHQTPAEKRAWEEAAARWERYDLGDWDFGDLPERVVVSEASGYPLYAFPGLQHDNAQVNLRLFRTPDEAMAATQNAVPRLAERTLQREMGWLQKDLRALDRHGVFYVTLGAAGELQDTAFENLRRHLFPEPEPGIRTASSFDEYVGRAREKLPGLTARLVDWVGAILEKRQQILVCPQPFPGLRAELDALVPPQFLLRIPFERLAQLPRYLKALQVRAERASVNRVKDVEKALRVKPYTDALSQFQRSAGKDREAAELLDRLRWLVEEFKVSCFAQELGTAEPVSPRKLDALLEETRTRFGQSGRPGASS